MKQILRNKGVPEDVAYLPLVESGFNPNACSKAKAVGQWQFIEETAKRYGLHIDFWRDERKDPVKATQAASDYLKDLYNQFGSWDLAMAAYNVGENRIQRLVSRDNLKGYLDVSQSVNLPDETKKYVPGYLATLRIVANPEAYGFTDLKYEYHIDYDEVVITSPATLDAIAKAAGSTVHEIRDLNPELKQWCTPLNTSEYLLRIPKGTVNDFIAKFSNSNVQPGEIVRQYALQKNDTIKKISRYTGVSEEIIKAMNPGLSMKSGNAVMLPPKNAVVDASHLMARRNTINKIKQYAFHKTRKSDRHKKLYATKGHGLRHRHSV
jgi:membrane-bound lytic murein transglycosylase D